MDPSFCGSFVTTAGFVTGMARFVTTARFVTMARFVTTARLVTQERVTNHGAIVPLSLSRLFFFFFNESLISVHVILSLRARACVCARAQICGIFRRPSRWVLQAQECILLLLRIQHYQTFSFARYDAALEDLHIYLSIFRFARHASR